MSNPFGGNIFGAIWEAAEKNTESRANECQKIMKEVINKKTGALADSVEIEKISDGHYRVGINENKLVNDRRNTEHKNYVKDYYYGTKEHIIRAKPGKTLHWRKNGKDHYAKSVKHPGTEPHNFIQDTLDRMRK